MFSKQGKNTRDKNTKKNQTRKHDQIHFIYIQGKSFSEKGVNDNKIKPFLEEEIDTDSYCRKQSGKKTDYYYFSRLPGSEISDGFVPIIFQ
jgi:hypothetical protein